MLKTVRKHFQVLAWAAEINLDLEKHFIYFPIARKDKVLVWDIWYCGFQSPSSLFSSHQTPTSPVKIFLIISCGRTFILCFNVNFQFCILNFNEKNAYIFYCVLSKIAPQFSKIIRAGMQFIVKMSTIKTLYDNCYK